MPAEDQRTERPSRRGDLLQAIAKEEARLARLEAAKASAKNRLVVLEAELAWLGSEPEIRVRFAHRGRGARSNKTSAEKVKLFRSLFRGRDEVFPTRFVSKKTGKPGYACLPKQVCQGRLRAAEGQVRRVFKSSVYTVRRRGRRCPPHRAARHGHLSAPR